VTPLQARQLLGVAAGASADDVERAFRRLAGRHHPDRGGDPGTFTALVAARDVLLRQPDQVIVISSGRWRRALRVVQRWRFRMRQPRPSARVR
jgi:hypothetical protein